MGGFSFKRNQSSLSKSNSKASMKPSTVVDNVGVETSCINTMEADEIFKLNREKNSNLLDNDESVSIKKKNNKMRCNCRTKHEISSMKSLIRQQICSINCMFSIKIKTLYLLMNLFLLSVCLVQAGFWTFYFPNFLKPSGYNELTDMIVNIETELNSTKDAYADIQYFWGLMKQMDDADESTMYPEESVCSDVFPMFRDMAIEYARIDYEHFLQPMLDYRQHLIECRSRWYPEGPKSKSILPREWEQSLYEVDLELKMIWLRKLAENPEYQNMRKQMVNIWKSVKRSLDTSLPCVYLRYSYRQVAEDINQLALDMNLKGMRNAMSILKDAYGRIGIFKESERSAKEQIAEQIKMKKISDARARHEGY